MTRLVYATLPDLQCKFKLWSKARNKGSRYLG